MFALPKAFPGLGCKCRRSQFIRHICAEGVPEGLKYEFCDPTNEFNVNDSLIMRKKRYGMCGKYNLSFKYMPFS